MYCELIHKIPSSMRIWNIRMLEEILCIYSQYIYSKFKFRKKMLILISQAKLISHSKFPFFQKLYFKYMYCELIHKIPSSMRIWNMGMLN